jgi:hypothetical protein
MANISLRNSLYRTDSLLEMVFAVCYRWRLTAALDTSSPTLFFTKIAYSPISSWMLTSSCSPTTVISISFCKQMAISSLTVHRWGMRCGLPTPRAMLWGYVIMQGDGNLVAYSAGGTPFWAAATEGHPGAWAHLQDDGNFVVYDSGNTALWASNTVQDFNSPTFQYTDASGYKFDETSEQWKQMCTSFPCFALLEWPGYATQVVETTIEGQAVVIQLWKGTCQKFLGPSDFPGGVGAEVGVYHQMPGRARPTLDQLVNSGVPKVLAAFIIAGIAPLTDNQLW